MNYLNVSNKLIPLLQLCQFYSIPSDISKIIFDFLINRSAQIIINSWYNYVMIHNINLVHIISNLQLHMNYDIYGMPFYYYNLYDKRVGITFNICYKYIDLKICDIDWWLHCLTYAFNELRFFDNIHNRNFKYNSDAIMKFYNLLNIGRDLN